jgi:sortase B
MNDGSMFASIVNYKKQEYYTAHPNLYLNTPSGNYRLAVFSGFVTYADSSVYTFDFAGDADFMDYVAKMKGFSDFSSDVTVSASDRIAVLSTCTYEYDDARYVLFAKMVPIA